MNSQSHIINLNYSFAEAFALAFRESQVALGQAICLLVVSKYHRATPSLGLIGLILPPYWYGCNSIVSQSNDISKESSCSFRKWEKVLCPTLLMNMVTPKGLHLCFTEFHCSARPSQIKLDLSIFWPLRKESSSVSRKRLMTQITVNRQPVVKATRWTLILIIANKM